MMRPRNVLFSCLIKQDWTRNVKIVSRDNREKLYCMARRLLYVHNSSWNLRDTPRARLTLSKWTKKGMEGRAVSRAHYLESSVADDKGPLRCRKLKSLSTGGQKTSLEEERSGRIQPVIPLIRLRRRSTHRLGILSELAGFPDDRTVSDYILLFLPPTPATILIRVSV